VEKSISAQLPAKACGYGKQENSLLEDLLRKKLEEKDALRADADIAAFLAPELKYHHAKERLDEFISYAGRIKEKLSQPTVTLEQLFEVSYGYFITMKNMHTLMNRLSYARSKASSAIFIDDFICNEFMLEVAEEVEKKVQYWGERYQACLTERLEQYSQEKEALEKTLTINTYQWLKRKGGRYTLLSDLLEKRSEKIKASREIEYGLQDIQNEIGDCKQTDLRLKEIARLTIADFTLYNITDAGRIFSKDRKLPASIKLEFLLDAYDRALQYITPPFIDKNIASRFTQKLGPLIRRIAELLDDREPEKPELCYKGLQLSRQSAHHIANQKETLSHVAYFARQVFMLEYLQNDTLAIQYLDDFFDAASADTDVIRQEWDAWSSNGRNLITEKEIQLTTHAIMHSFIDLSRFLKEDIGIKRICKEKALHKRVLSIEHTYTRFFFVARKLTPERYAASVKEPDFWKLG